MMEFEKAMGDMSDVDDELDILLYAVGDSRVRPTDDQIMNMIIGIKEMQKFRYLQLQDGYENLIRQIRDKEIKDEDLVF